MIIAALDGSSKGRLRGEGRASERGITSEKGGGEPVVVRTLVIVLFSILAVILCECICRQTCTKHSGTEGVD